MARATEAERLMLDLINEERAREGLDPLALEQRLNDAADAHTAWMLDTGAFSHAGEGGSNGADRIQAAALPLEGRWAWGENLAWQSERGAPGIADDVADLHRSLMGSPSHRAAILDPNFEAVGIGIGRGDYRGFDAVVATQNFALTAAALRLDRGSPGPEPDPDPDPAPGGVPAVEVDDVVLAPGERIHLADVLSAVAGDASIRSFHFRDAQGGASLELDGRGAVDASEGGPLHPGRGVGSPLPRGRRRALRARAHGPGLRRAGTQRVGDVHRDDHRRARPHRVSGRVGQRARG